MAFDGSLSFRAKKGFNKPRDPLKQILKALKQDLKKALKHP